GRFVLALPRAARLFVACLSGCRSPRLRVAVAKEPIRRHLLLVFEVEIVLEPPCGPRQAVDVAVPILEGGGLQSLRVLFGRRLVPGEWAAGSRGKRRDLRRVTAGRLVRG